MKKIEMYEFIKGFAGLENLEGYEFVKGVTKNYNLFKNELEVLEKAKNTNKGFGEYQEAVQAVIRENAKKDENGEFIIGKDEAGRENYTLIEENITKGNKKLKSLETKHKDAITTQQENEQKFLDELNSEVSEDLSMINESDIPKNITAKQMKLVFSMIKFD